MSSSDYCSADPIQGYYVRNYPNGMFEQAKELLQRELLFCATLGTLIEKTNELSAQFLVNL